MPLGADIDLSTINQGDSADLYTYIYDANDDPILSSDISGVVFTIQDPSGAQVTAPGVIQGDGAGFVRYTDTTLIGTYVALGRFTLTNGEIRSVRMDFTVVDPFNPPTPTGVDILSDTVWMMLEDCFDSEDGGPWLRDMTLAYFNKNKVSKFIPFALLDINVAPHPSNNTITDFTMPEADGSPNASMPVLAYGTLIHVIRHLMRSYVEQPTPQGAQVVYEDRRDYLQRWQIILQDLQEEYIRILTLWKRSQLNLGKSALLVHSKAGRLYGPGYYRTRGVRPWW